MTGLAVLIGLGIFALVWMVRIALDWLFDL